MSSSVAGNLSTLDPTRWVQPDTTAMRRPHTESGAMSVLPVIPEQTRLYTSVKRIADIVFAVSLLCLLGPLMGVVALLVKLTSPGGVFFTQIFKEQHCPVLETFK